MCLEGRSSKCDRSFVFRDNAHGTVVLKCSTSQYMVEFNHSIGKCYLKGGLIKYLQSLGLFVVKLMLISILSV